MKKIMIVGICMAALFISSNVYAVDLGDAIDGAMETAGNVSTEELRFADVDFQIPTYYVKDETSTDSQLKYHTADQQIELTFYQGDYTNGADEFNATKKDIVSDIVAGTQDGELLNTEDCTMAGFEGIKLALQG